MATAATSAHTRPWPGIPDDGVTVQQITDSHLGYEPWSYDQANGALDDFASAMIEHVAAVVHTGDITDDGGQVPSSADKDDGRAQDTFALSWLPKMARGLPDLWCVGNHDLRDRTSGSTRTEWEKVYGRPANSYIDVGPAGRSIRFIGLAPDSCEKGTAANQGSTDPWTIPQATLDWANQAIAGAERAVLCNHYPLCEMAASDGADPQAGLDELIGDNPAVVAYLSGHMHWMVTSARVTQMVRIGGRPLPAVCATSLPFHSPTATTGTEAYSQGDYAACWSTFHTFCDDGRLQVRYRNHGAHLWGAPRGGRVVTFDPAADGTITVS